MRLIDADALKEQILSGEYIYCQVNKEDIADAIDNAPTVTDRTEEVLSLQNTIAKLVEGIAENARPQGEFSRKDLESWLYQIAMNNIGTDFEKSVVEIIHRLDGFERFVSEQKGGAE